MTNRQGQLRPCLAELLRTCIKPASLVLQVDQIVTQGTTADEVNPSDTQSSESVHRYYLTDGHLVIQALIKPQSLSEGDPKEGDIVVLRDVIVKKAKRLNGNGRVIYLGIQELEILSHQQPEEREEGGGFIKTENGRDLDKPTSKTCKPDHNRVTFAEEVYPSPKRPSAIKKPRSMESEHKRQAQEAEDGAGDTSGSDGFESLDIDLDKIRQRRQKLHGLQQPTLSLHQTNENNNWPSLENPIAALNPKAKPEPEHIHQPSSQKTKPNHKPSSPPPHQQPNQPTHNPIPLTPPYHPLSTLSSPTLPSNNYPLTTLAIITYTSPTLLHPRQPNSPFPPKRHLKLLDPSLLTHTPTHMPNQGLTLAVYVNAQSFLPKPGTIALFRGIVMQRHGETVILNAYANIQDRLGEGKRWYVDDEAILEEMGFDVVGMKRWWEERHRTNSTKNP